MRYIAVIHAWHVYSKGFTQHELEAKTEEDAHKEASAICFEEQGTCKATDYTLVEIEDNERLNLLSRIPMWVRKLYKAV